MNRMIQGVRRFLREDEGAAIAEYGLLLAIVAVGLIAILTAFRNDIATWWNGMREDITATPTDADPNALPGTP
ncbi:MAG TPA: Flp family type IVb pilin [Gemmatimonadaceae bacterium]|jgi:pilus assembly protein Flp/PilA|nr:Flp family type IVb pilin [Gemmatimonadaceae bacterium]